MVTGRVPGGMDSPIVDEDPTIATIWRDASPEGMVRSQN